MDTTEDMLRLIEVIFSLQKVNFIGFHGPSQKILDNSKHVEASKQSIIQRIHWNYFVESVLGLKPVHVTNQSNLTVNADQKDGGAFELLRV